MGTRRLKSIFRPSAAWAAAGFAGVPAAGVGCCPEVVRVSEANRRVLKIRMVRSRFPLSSPVILSASSCLNTVHASPPLIARTGTREVGLTVVASPRRSRLFNPVEGHVADSVQLPILVIEVPPLSFEHLETFRLHRGAQQVAVPALEGGAARVVRGS